MKVDFQFILDLQGQRSLKCQPSHADDLQWVTHLQVLKTDLFIPLFENRALSGQNVGFSPGCFHHERSALYVDLGDLSCPLGSLAVGLVEHEGAQQRDQEKNKRYGFFLHESRLPLPLILTESHVDFIWKHLTLEQDWRGHYKVLNQG